ncbi:MAG: carboxypeptidase-like regulatory domain-containing protein [Gemmataceae bacterium]
MTVVDAAGRPLPGRTVTVDRPHGPLSAALWPAGWTTDGAGRVDVPALEAGRHQIRVAGAEPVTVELPPLATRGVTTMTVRVGPAGR